MGHLYRRVIPVEPPPEEEDDFSPPLARPPKPVYSSKYEGGKYMSGVEAFLGEDGNGFKYRNIRKTSLTGVSSTGGSQSHHRSRERKLAQREKEKEKERECWASQYT